MNWDDQGIVLAARRHGESAVLLGALTATHGRHMGLVRGGAGGRLRGALQPGNELALRWQARLSEYLGTYTCELTQARTAALIEDGNRLAALTAACALAEVTVPERAPQPGIHAALGALLDALDRDDGWELRYVRFEFILLAELGFGLDLTACAVTGATEGLAFVSPRTGRAVVAAAAGRWRDRLLALPPFLVEPGRAPRDRAETVAALTLSGHFIEHHLLIATGTAMPPARIRLIDRLTRGGATSGRFSASDPTEA